MTLLDKQGPSTAKGGESDGEHIEQDHAVSIRQQIISVLQDY